MVNGGGGGGFKKNPPPPPGGGGEPPLVLNITRCLYILAWTICIFGHPSIHLCAHPSPVSCSLCGACTHTRLKENVIHLRWLSSKTTLFYMQIELWWISIRLECIIWTTAPICTVGSTISGMFIYIWRIQSIWRLERTVHNNHIWDMRNMWTRGYRLGGPGGQSPR